MIILNEKKYAARLIENGAFENKPYNDLQIIARYLYHVDGYRKKRIEKYLLTFLDDHYPAYKANKFDWASTVEKIASKAGKYPLIEIESIDITQSELDKIDAIEHSRHRRVAFTMLCLAKLGNMRNENNNGWVNTELRDIFNLARVSVTIVQQDLIIGDLGILGLLEFPKQNGNLSSRVTFIDNYGKPVINVTEIDFKELGYVYMKYCGENIIRCENCGVLTRGGKTHRKKYCSSCSGSNDSSKGQHSTTKIIKCIDCGIDFEVSSYNTKALRCADCQHKHRLQSKRLQMQKYRANI